ncbi:MAG: hypothetical protein M3R27_13800 [Bacteroidota bacterium]|nr:hypothetical protein [Bacteroidota bacterium]
MKKILLSAAIAVMSFSTLSAQKSFEGSITYSINFDGSGLPPEAMDMLKGAETTTYIKNEKRRVDMNMPMQSTSTYMNAKEKNIVTTMDIMGQKYLIRTSEADIKKDQESQPETIIKYTDETKEIAGYKCKKAEITVKSKDGKEEIVTVFYTEKIPASELKSAFKGLKGFPLEYSMSQSGIKMKFFAKTVSKEKVADTKFEIPKEGYRETTLEELQKEMSGGQ